VEAGLRLIAALAFYWYFRGSPHEGRAWLEAMLARTGSSDRSVARGRALHGAGWLAWFEGDFAAAAPYVEESVSIMREAGDKHWTAYAGVMLGLVRLSQGNIEEARSLFEESYRLDEELGDVWAEALALFGLGNVAYRSGDLVTARSQFEESLRLFREQGDVLYASMVLSELQGIALILGDQEQARSLHEQALPFIRQAHNRGMLGLFLINLGEIYQQYGEEQLARVSYREGLSLWQDMHQVEQRLGIVRGLAAMAEMAAAAGQAERAGQLFGAAARLLPTTSSYREEVDRRVTAARAGLDAATFEAGWTAGQAMTEEQAITEALQDA
jgi:tetratricopeptide (TPR) repeat protein